MEPSIVISVTGLVLTALLAYWGAQKGVTAKIAKLDEKVDTLSNRVEKHNNVIDRMYTLEEHMRWIDKELERIVTNESRV